MPDINILIKKYGGRIIVWVLGVVFTTWFSSLLTPSFTEFNTYLIDKSWTPISNTFVFIQYILDLKIPIYSIIFFFIVVWIMYKIYRKFLLSRRDFKIISAEYGSGNKFVDMTNQLNDYVVDNKLKITLSNGILGFDPTPGIVKIGKIKYQNNNKISDTKYKESDTIDLP